MKTRTFVISAGRPSIRVSFWLLAATLLSLLTPPANAANNPVPLIDQPLVPTATAPSGPAFTLHIRGAGFVSGSVVNWDGGALATTFVSSAQLTATVPATNIALPGTASVTVTNPAPGGGMSNSVFFQVIRSTPTVVMPESDNALSVQPLSLVTADFNGDGKLDIASVSYSSNTVSILLGNGDGTFQPPVDYAGPSSGPEAQWLTVGDFNGDGKLDLAVCTGDGIGSGSVFILLGNGDGTFQPPTKPFPTHGSAVVIATADFNRDGKLDLVVGYEAGDDGFLSVALGNGDGTFGPFHDYAAGKDNTSIVLGDFDNDGKIDIATSDTFGGDASLLLGNGDGTFKAPTIFSNQLFPDGITAADFNRDGNLDLVLPVDFGVTVFLGNGNGTFQPGANYACGAQPLTSSVSVADFNGDGKLDIVVPCNGAVSILLGNGDGTFQPPLRQSVNSLNMQALAVGDFNQDGHIDVAVIDSATGSGTVSALLQSTLYVSPSGVGFKYSHLVGTKTAPLPVKLTNFGASTLSLGTIAVNGADSADFPIQNKCGSTLAPGLSCTVFVVFKPANSGSRQATLSIPNNTLGLTQSVALFGLGTFLSLTPSSLNFGNVQVGQTSPPQNITLANTGTNSIGLVPIVIEGANTADFSQTNNCGASIAGGNNCAITVTFTPTATGARNGAVVVRDNGGGGEQRVHLSGTGT
jgi:hypothetical protein